MVTVESHLNPASPVFSDYLIWLRRNGGGVDPDNFRKWSKAIAMYRKSALWVTGMPDGKRLI